MPNLIDNLKQWRDSARIDWLSQFIKAWIPFNAGMTDTYGDLSDRELLDHVKGVSNVVYNRLLSPSSPVNPVGCKELSSAAVERGPSEGARSGSKESFPHPRTSPSETAHSVKDFDSLTT